MVNVTTRSGKGSELTHAELDANFVDLANALNSLLPQAIAYSATIPLDGNKAMPRTAITGPVEFSLGSVSARGQCKVAIVANGTNAPTYASGINIDPASDSYNNTAQRLHNLFFWNDGDLSWVTVMDTGITVAAAATSLSVTGPSSGTVGAASSSFTVAANGAISEPLTVTPSSNIAGTFSPSSASLSSGGSVVFSYTPSATGAASLTFSATGLTSASATYTVNAASTAPSQVGTVTLGTATTSSQALSWAAPSDGGSAITDYVVQYAPAGSGSWTTFNDGVNTGIGATVSGLSPSTSYDYRVAAVNAVGQGAYSATVTGSTAAAATVPGAPTVGTATAGDASASVTFTAPASNGWAAITSYTVTSSPGGITATGTASPINVTGLTNGTAYTFTVTATNSVGTSAASAASNSVTPTAAAPAYTITGYQGNAVRTTSDATSATVYGSIKQIPANETASGQFTTPPYWTITPAPASAVAGWGTSATVAPATITQAENQAAGSSINGMTPMTKPGAFRSQANLWVPVGSGSTTWYYWIKPVDGAAQMVGTLNVVNA